MLSLFTSGASLQDILLQIALTVPVILIALTFHEVAHGFVSYKLGDPTAYNQGRLSLNPLKHLDPIGTLCMLLFGVGWARPVPVNSRYYKKPKLGMALTALAGPFMNLLLGFVGVIIMGIVWKIASLTGGYTHLLEVMDLFFYYFATMNVYLAVFNLLPVPPFDGSRILFIFLPDRLYFGIMRYERIIQIVILVALWAGILTLPVEAISDVILNGMFFLINLVL